MTEEEVRSLPPAKRRELDRQRLLAEADHLYEIYGKPLEGEHLGKFLAISRDGGIVLGEDIEDVSERAAEALGQGSSFLFRIGEMSVGKIR